LNENSSLTLDEARMEIEAWRRDYNHARPHSVLGYQTPEEFAARETRKRAATDLEAAGRRTVAAARGAFPHAPRPPAQGVDSAQELTL
jgi:putative transposase